MISWYFDLDNKISKLLQIDAVWYQSITKHIFLEGIGKRLYTHLSNLFYFLNRSFGSWKRN